MSRFFMVHCVHFQQTESGNTVFKRTPLPCKVSNNSKLKQMLTKILDIVEEGDTDTNCVKLFVY